VSLSSADKFDGSESVHLLSKNNTRWATAIKTELWMSLSNLASPKNKHPISCSIVDVTPIKVVARQQLKPDRLHMHGETLHVHGRMGAI